MTSFKKVRSDPKKSCAASSSSLQPSVSTQTHTTTISAQAKSNSQNQGSYSRGQPVLDVSARTLLPPFFCANKTLGFISDQQERWYQVINQSPMKYFKNTTTPKTQGGTQLILDTKASRDNKGQNFIMWHLQCFCFKPTAQRVPQYPLTALKEDTLNNTRLTTSLHS